jgi:hypothetical protein
MTGRMQDLSPSPSGEGLGWGLFQSAGAAASIYTFPTHNPSPEGEGL